MIAIGFMWPEKNQRQASDINVAEALSEGEEGFKRVLSPRDFHFPEDHGPHPDYKTEWWYFTGNLESKSGRRFGYQLTLFRVGLKADAAKRTSQWGTAEIYMGHFAVTDQANQKFYRFERFSRSALGLAGAQANPFQVWLENWRIYSKGNKFLPITLQASDEDVAIHLVLNSSKPIILQGDKGLSQKSSEKGNASYYYSMTRMPTSGEIVLAGNVYKVNGESWLDREWSTSALGKTQAGWDWFSLQLSDGRDIMFYRLRKKDGRTDFYSAGSIVSADGSFTPLESKAVQLVILKEWKSSESGIRYPIQWRMEIPTENLMLEVKAIQSNQEMLLSAHYWEGAVNVSGMVNNTPVTGRGYLELAGYE